MLGLTAENIGTIILGISIAIISLMGGQKGKQIAQGKPQQQGDLIEVAGAIVSDKAVDRMVKSMDALSASNTMLTHAINTDVEAKTALTKAMAENSRALDHHSDIAEEMQDEIKDAGARMDRLKDELIRSGHR